MERENSSIRSRLQMKHKERKCEIVIVRLYIRVLRVFVCICKYMVSIIVLYVNDIYGDSPPERLLRVLRVYIPVYAIKFHRRKCRILSMGRGYNYIRNISVIDVGFL